MHGTVEAPARDLHVVHGTSMRRLPHKQSGGYAGVAFLCGAAATLFYAWPGVMTWWRHAIPRPIAVLVGVPALLAPAFFLMAPGVLLRPSAGRIAWLALGTFVGSILFTGARAMYSVNYLGGPPPPWPDFDTFGLPTLVAAVMCLYFGILLVAGVPGRWWLKLLSPVAAGVIVLGAAILFQMVLRPQECVLLQRWELATIVVGGPGLCLLAWLPLDLLDKRGIAQQSAAADLADSPAEQ